MADLWPEMWRWPVGQQALLWLAAAMVIAAAWSYLVRSRSLSWPRRLMLLALRLLASAVLVGMLLGPAHWQATGAGTTLPPTVLVLADVSASMDQQDVAGFPGLSRWEALERTWLSPDARAAIEKLSRVTWYQFDKVIRPDTGSPTLAEDQLHLRLGTDLFGALDKAVGGVEADRPGENSGGTSGGVVLVLSDGHDTRRASDGALLARLKRQGWPVHVVPVGSDQRSADVSLLAWAQSGFVLEGQTTVLQAAISQRGYAGQATQVDLLLEGRLIESQKVQFPLQGSGDGQVTVSFPIQPRRVGNSALSVLGYQIVVRPMAGEQQLDNNSRWIFVQVSRQHVKVALFEASPYWDTRFLAQALRDDPQVSLTTVFGLGPDRLVTGHYNAGPSPVEWSWPMSGEQLAQFDVILLGRGCEQFFPGRQAQLLVDFVRQQGGALVFARGRAFDVATPAGEAAQSIIAPIEPVEWGRQMVDDLRLSLSPAGRRSPLLEFNLPEETDAILTRLPGMLAATRIAREKSASVVLLTQSPTRADGQAVEGASAMAAVAHQNVGAGQVLAILSDGLWQWAFLPGTLKRYDSIYHQFWARTIRWLATGGQFLPGQSLSLSLSSLGVEPHEPVTVTVAARHVESFPGALSGVLPGALPGALPGGAVRVIAPDGSTQPVAMGRASEQSNRWTGRFTPTAAGVHVVELVDTGTEPGRLTARLAVYDQSVEIDDPSAQPRTLRALASATGGQVYGLDQQQAFVDHLRNIQLSQESDRKLADVFDNPWALAVLLASLGMEWLIRRRNALA